MKKLLLVYVISILGSFPMLTPGPGYKHMAFTMSGHYFFATNCAIAAGSSPTTFSTALTAAGSGTCTGTSASTAVSVAAGTYTGFSSRITIPCGVTSFSGPVVAYSPTHNQTAILQGTGSQTDLGFTYGPCTMATPPVIQYFEWDGKSGARTSTSGGFIITQGGTNGLIIQHNFIHGMGGCNNDASHNCDSGSTNGSGVSIGGFSSSSPVISQNISVIWNEFGGETYGDCSAAMSDQETNAGGGYCNGVGIENSTANVFVEYNIFHYLEQGAKYYEVSSYSSQQYCSPFYFSYNALTQVNRIAYETQCNIGTATYPTLQYVQYNYIGNRYSGADSLFDLSIANGCGNVHGNYCVNHVDYNADLQNVATSTPSAGFEFWGQDGGTGNYNLFEGYAAATGGGFDISQNGYFTFNNNTFNIHSGGGTDCNNTTGGYWNHEDNPAYSRLSCTGNTYSNVGTGTYTSVQPTISPAGGTYGTTQTITLTNPGTNRDTNTTIWYTTDGSTPVPGSGTTKAYTNPFNVTSTTTVKSVGMWGALNQPYSYPSNFGYVPSAALTTVYTISGGAPTLTACNMTGTSSVAIGSFDQIGATCTYSGISPTSCGNTPDSQGNIVNPWVTSNSAVFSIGAYGSPSGCSGSAQGPGCVKGLGVGTANAGGSVNAIVCSPLAVTVGHVLQTLTITTTGSLSSIPVGATNQILPVCAWNDPSVDTCPGLTITYTTSDGTKATVTVNGGLITGVATGSVTFSASALGVTSNTLPLTIVSATPALNFNQQGLSGFQGKVSIQ